MKNLNEGKKDTISKNAVNTANSDTTVSTKGAKSILSARQYCEISADVWNIFKKYIDADLGSFTDDVHELDRKYHEANNLEAYKFMQRLMKVYFDELTRIRG